jgi:hypothetical protein
MVVAIARCGLACEVCMHFDLKCLGCEKENSFNSRCPIYDCSKEKKIKYCLECMEYPCKFMVGLSKAYCPIHSVINTKKAKQLFDIQLIQI